MLVSDILNAKGTDIFSISPDSSVAEAAALLTQRRIGSLLVLRDGAIAGILSERDIVRALASRGTDSLRASVGDIMTAKVVTCGPAQTISEVMEIMTSGRFRHVPVLEDGALAGMISIGDVVKWRLEEAQEEVRQMTAYVAGM